MVFEPEKTHEGGAAMDMRKGGISKAWEEGLSV
jgi:hypothetical protein